MRKILIILFLIPLFANTTTYYVSTAGSDGNAGTSLATAFLTWAKGFSVLTSGDILLIKGGTYIPPNLSGDYITYCNSRNGSSGSHITVQPYYSGANIPANWEHPILDASSLTITTNTIGLYVSSCSYIDFKGLRVTGFAENSAGGGTYVDGWSVDNSSTQITFELCEVDHIGGAGFRIKNCTGGVFSYLNCDAHHNWDNYHSGGDADGFSTNAGTTTLTGCRSYDNSDDGFDNFYNDDLVTYQNCWSFRNGYEPGTMTTAGNGNGFKWGILTTSQSGVIRRIYKNCLSAINRSWAFDENGAVCKVEFYNNTTYGNGGGGWAIGYSATPVQADILKNNISYNETPAVYSFTNLVEDHNTWNGGVTVTNGDFVSISSTGLDGSRQPDGSLPATTFLNLVTGSDLIGAGTNGGIGLSLDLGAFPFTVTIPPVIRTIQIRATISRQ